MGTLSDLLMMSRVTLHRKLKLTAGIPASILIRTVRLDYAASLLEQGELNIHQVALASGFYNQSYFSKCFRRRFGIKPSAYLHK